MEVGKSVFNFTGANISITTGFFCSELITAIVSLSLRMLQRSPTKMWGGASSPSALVTSLVRLAPAEVRGWEQQGVGAIYSTRSYCCPPALSTPPPSQPQARSTKAKKDNSNNNDVSSAQCHREHQIFWEEMKKRSCEIGKS